MGRISKVLSCPDSVPSAWAEAPAGERTAWTQMDRRAPSGLGEPARPAPRETPGASELGDLKLVSVPHTSLPDRRALLH